MPKDHAILIHISDLHLGWPLDRKQLAIGPSGLYAHDVALCRGLKEFFADLTASSDFTLDSAVVVMSGDGTSKGAANEFDVLKSLLQTHCGELRYILIPGNHDHWEGKIGPYRGYNPGIKPDPFPHTPFSPTEIIQSSQNGFNVVLHGVDSNSGFDTVFNHNPFAEGAIDYTEFADLAASVAKSQRIPNSVHFLVCHHSFAKRGMLPVALSPHSRENLLDLAKKHPILAVLTGHQHTFWFQDWKATRVDNSIAALAEFRSPTTTKGPEPSPTANRMHRPGLWTYELVLNDDSSVTMTPTPYVWNGHRFANMPRNLIAEDDEMILTTWL